MAFGGMGIAVAIAVVVFVKRRRAQRAAGVLTARPGCVPTYLPEPAGIVQCAAAIVSHIQENRRLKKMKVGIFDHVERAADRPIAQTLDERLKFAAAADEAGIYCLHVAEHHATPLNLVPVPGVYLGALARATKRMRIGPLVYLLHARFRRCGWRRKSASSTT